MKEQLEKDLRKYKWFIVWSVLGLIFIRSVFFYTERQSLLGICSNLGC